jgi:hypothetical protein
MKISAEEHRAILTVIKAGQAFGYGNLIEHLKSAWAVELIEKYRLSEDAAREAAGGGYPLAMHADLVKFGEWDETGLRYKKSK